MSNKVMIIAEGGVNHNGSITLAKKLVSNAKKSGADYIKFQYYITENIVLKNSKLAKYQKKNSTNKSSQYDLLKKLELSKEDIYELYKFAKKIKQKIFFSVFDIESFNFINGFNFDYIKIPSGEIDNYPLLDSISRFKNKIILSTGMSNLIEIKSAIKILTKNVISKKNINILHCNTEYPSPINDINMNAMVTLRKKFKINVGYSDHSESLEVPIIATSLGAKIIEKHFTLNKKLSGPDHRASLNPQQFKKMVSNIRNTEIILGSFTKKLSISEKNNIKVVRKSIVANQNIKKGEIFSIKNLTIKRPAGGIPSSLFYKMIGKKSKKNYKKDQQI